MKGRSLSLMYGQSRKTKDLLIGVFSHIDTLACSSSSYLLGPPPPPPLPGSGWDSRVPAVMGCFHSKTSNVHSPEDDSLPADKRDLPNGDGGDQDQVPSFKEYGLAELRAATKEFSPQLIVSESGEKAPNVVYRGKLDGGRLVAVKRFSKQSWPDAQQFVAEAAGVGKVRHKKLVNLIGCCAEGDERLLVAEFMPNDTLSKHLFHCMELYLSYLLFLFLFFSNFEPFLFTNISFSVVKPILAKRKQEDGFVLFWKNEIVDGWGGNLVRDNGWRHWYVCWDIGRDPYTEVMESVTNLMTRWDIS